MDTQTLTAFFKWCTIINVAVFILSAIMIITVPDFIYATQGQLFDLPRDALNISLYAFLGIFKLAILIFNLVPYVAQRIIAKNSK